MILLRIAAWLLLSLACAWAQLTPENIAAIDKLAAKALEDSGTPAVSIAAVKDGRIALVKAYGDARLDPRTPAAPEMRFSIGSVSKQFLAAAMLLLAEDQKVSLDDHVGKYLPGLTRADEVTIRQLLSHTSGYQDYYPQDYVPPFMREPVTAEGILDRWARKPLDFEPGSQWQYSNTGFVIAGRIIEKITGRPFIEFLRTRIFTPLEMRSVIDLDKQQLTARDAAGYIRYAIGPLHTVTPEAPGWLFAAGELAMTASDLARWDVALLSGKLLKPRSFEQMTTPIRLSNGAPGTYALGLAVSNEQGHLRLTHDGAVTGFASQNTLWPDQHAAVVVLSNQDVSSAPRRITAGVQKVLLAPAQDPDAARLLEQARTIFAGLQEGRIDRSPLTPNCRAYFTPEVLHDYGQSLKPLGVPRSFELVRSGIRGGFTDREYRIEFPAKTLRLIVRGSSDGRLEQYQIFE
jgi:D-alanyl-D-alanine carboxypeptidase